MTVSVSDLGYSKFINRDNIVFDYNKSNAGWDGSQVIRDGLGNNVSHDFFSITHTITSQAEKDAISYAQSLWAKLLGSTSLSTTGAATLHIYKAEVIAYTDPYDTKFDQDFAGAVSINNPTIDPFPKDALKLEELQNAPVESWLTFESLMSRIPEVSDLFIDIFNGPTLWLHPSYDAERNPGLGLTNNQRPSRSYITLTDLSARQTVEHVAA